ncbi:hypothetical protein VP01_528g1 [Puccinia sorghi]|uniref:Uncharacterized protein n=1 Tax=Puccinia sorghi TaxID=27349 RepID=A0A0L6UMA8_9BASI|nr:hypothetical protein VP01_528g1 [Puccinia sorghi]
MKMMKKKKLKRLKNLKLKIKLKMKETILRCDSQPSAASKKKIKIKTDTHKTSQFEKILPQCVASEKNDQKTKEMKVQPTQTVNPALGHGQGAFMDVGKEIHDNIKVQSELYLNQGFLDEIKRVAQIIHVEELGPCDIYHWMRMPTMGLTEIQNSVVLKMKGENLFPAAQLENNWEQIATPEAMQWKNRYMSCFELTQRLKLEILFG